MKSSKKTERITLNVMKKKRQIGLIILGIIFLDAIIIAQTSDWKTEITKDGRITVQSNVSKRTDEMGNKVLFIEYVATTTLNVNMQACIAVLRDVP